ncbi:hypothetical protein [Desulforamulus hydrothermalis]|nr:hypothetical protein [Desulforamulus hydrothermalis]
MIPCRRLVEAPVTALDERKEPPAPYSSLITLWQWGQVNRLPW